MKEGVHFKLTKLYEDLSRPSGYGSFGDLKREARREGIKVRDEELRKFLSKYDSYTLFRTRRRRSIPIHASSINERLYPYWRG